MRDHGRVTWSAPLAPGPVHGVVAVPGSKSVTNRALLLAALSGGPASVSGAPASRDTALMVGALRALGVPVEVDGERVAIGAHDGLRGGGTVDCGLAGTVMRFVPPAAALADGPVAFDGDPRARERPLATVLDALRALGARVDGDALPFTLHGTGGIPGGDVVIDASASSQFVSGLLLSGARYDKGVTVHHDGKPVPSLPHIDMTVAMLREAGVDVDDAEPNTWRVAPGAIRARDWAVEPDLSNAAVFLAAAAVTGGRVTVAGWPAASTQPGTEILAVLAEMGCDGRAGRRRDDRHRAGGAVRRRRRPARRQRAHPDRRRRRRAGHGPVADPGCSAHPRPRDRPARRARRRDQRAWAATSPRRRTGWRSARPPCTAAPGAPTPTTAWPRRAR